MFSYSLIFSQLKWGMLESACEHSEAVFPSAFSFLTTMLRCSTEGSPGRALDRASDCKYLSCNRDNLDMTAHHEHISEQFVFHVQRKCQVAFSASQTHMALPWAPKTAGMATTYKNPQCFRNICQRALSDHSLILTIATPGACSFHHCFQSEMACHKNTWTTSCRISGKCSQAYL